MPPPEPSMPPTAAQVRQQFIDFFVERHAHTFVPSSPVVPHDDPTLLFTNAGMNQFKPIFLGQADPKSAQAKLTRAANSQKCIRAGGKHNDLDDVGKDLYHHTFFEMLGNWSFGDYFKKEAIDWAWELLTKVWGVDPDRLYATYFQGDKRLGLDPDREAWDLWRAHLPERRILPGDAKDNFWEMGDTGPCGPCSEIHYDGRSDAERAQTPGDTLVNAGHPDVIEIWNLVFIQFNRVAQSGEGALRPLPAKHVDTGMGLERLVRVLQGKQSNYDTDLFTTLFDRIRKVTGAPAYTGALEDPRDIAYRVVADHARTLTFAITDGAPPSNEGRGYVLRRILRRAVRHGRQHLGAPGAFLCDIVPTIVETMGDAFPELRADPQRVIDIIREEEDSFGRTLSAGMQHFDDAAQRTDAKTVGAEDAFKLHDTYGFPIDLTQIMAAERGMTVDVAGFERLMEEARERSRAGGRAGGADALALGTDQVASLKALGVKPTNDSEKFTAKPVRARVKAIWNGTDFDEDLRASSVGVNDRFGLILDKTNHYAEMGGQVGDTGSITKSGAAFIIEDTRVFAGYVLHTGRIKSGALRVGDDVVIEVDHDRRAPIMANHTATHLLNHALRAVLHESADQKGSLVAPDRVRFDFACAKALTPEQITQAEQRVRDDIARDLPVHAEIVPLEQARAIKGLRAVFGEAYPDPVRVVSIGPAVPDLLANPDNDAWLDRSIEFCGGTHLARTGEAVAFAILSEEAVAKGVRRVTAITGADAERAVETGHRLLERAKAAALRTDEELHGVVQDINAALETETIPSTFRRHVQSALAELQERVKSAQKQAAAAGRDDAVAAARALAEQGGEGGVIVGLIPAGSDRQALLSAMDAVRAKHKDSAVLLASPDHDAGKVTIVAGVPEALIKKGLKAGDWVREASQACGGKGGGRPDSAQGGGSQPENTQAALDAARVYAAKIIG
ncbi:MAG: alanine--tRNA ligase [Phycisphaerales bacterium]|nr:MAG: alanine--tRNA ligase [Phycisphaerales bacterium]